MESPKHEKTVFILEQAQAARGSSRYKDVTLPV